MQEYLNLPHVQAALGVPLNFTQDSSLVDAVFTFDAVHRGRSFGDSARQGGVPDLEYALHAGIKVAMVYGDRDYRCPWPGGEKIAHVAAWAGQANFSAAGYVDLVSNPSYTAGLTKQFEGLSFTRLFHSGHEVGKYQTETVYRIFMRQLFGMDVATGTVRVGAGFKTKGIDSAWSKSQVPAHLPRTCMVAGQYQNVSVWEEVLNGTVDGY